MQSKLLDEEAKKDGDLMEQKINKQSIRRKFLERRDSLSLSDRKQKSLRIWENLKKEECFKQAEIVLVYMDYRSEVMTTGLVEELLQSQGGKKVYAPKVDGLDIDFYELTSLDELYPGYQQIREPEALLDKQFTLAVSEGKKCLVLVPGAVFDRELGRMGYGKGFYDRFIHNFPAITKVGLAFDCQITGQVPRESHDKHLDMIVTESEVIK